jgi:hypothetical protein
MLYMQRFCSSSYKLLQEIQTQPNELLQEIQTQPNASLKIKYYGL